MDHDRVGRYVDHIGWLVHHMREWMKSDGEAEALWEEACANITNKSTSRLRRRRRLQMQPSPLPGRQAEDQLEVQGIW